jgi:preprotein translocase subunit YajC
MISSAVAQEVTQAGAEAAPSAFSGLVPLLFIFVIFYFFIIRPQSKKYKTHQNMLSAIAKGDTVITNGGLHGKVVKVSDNGTLTVTIAKDVDVVVERSMIANAEVKALKKTGNTKS